jgi:uncharacterized damage-inducible protein DinB
LECRLDGALFATAWLIAIQKTEVKRRQAAALQTNMNLSDIRRLFDYTEWANDLALEAAGNLADEDLRRDFKISHGSIFGTLAHMAGAEWIWLERWNGRWPAKAEAWSLWTTESCANLATLKKRWSEVVTRRAQFISALDETRLAAEIYFKLLNGDPSSMRLVDQMQHVANHATLHRGQVVGMIRQLGIEPPSTDLLFYLRSDISPK